MGKSTIIPFGPQHPVLPEPIHLDLELKDEKVVKAIPSIGYVHRGLEKLVEKRGFQEYAPRVLHPKAECKGGILEEECRQLMQDFFKSKR